MFIRDSRRSYRAHSYSELIIITGLCSFETPVRVTELILIFRILFLYYGAYTCTKVLVGTTHFHYTEVPVGTKKILLVQKYPQVLQNNYRGTRRYYRTNTEVPVGTFRSLPYSILYSYSLFRVLSYNCLIPRPVIQNE